MPQYYKKKTVVIDLAKNGFIATVQGTEEEQQDGIDKGQYVFETSDKLAEFIKKYCDSLTAVVE